MSISFNEVPAVPGEVGEQWSAEEHAREHGIPYVGEHNVKVKAEPQDMDDGDDSGSGAGAA